MKYLMYFLEISIVFIFLLKPFLNLVNRKESIELERLVDSFPLSLTDVVSNSSAHRYFKYALTSLHNRPN